MGEFLDACERDRGVKIGSIVFEHTKWGRSVEIHTVEKRVIVTTARSGPAAKAYYRSLHVEADRFGPAERELLRLASMLEQAEGKPVHIFTHFKRRKDGTVREIDVMYELPDDLPKRH